MSKRALWVAVCPRCCRPYRRDRGAGEGHGAGGREGRDGPGQGLRWRVGRRGPAQAPALSHRWGETTDQLIAEDHGGGRGRGCLPLCVFDVSVVGHGLDGGSQEVLWGADGGLCATGLLGPAGGQTTSKQGPKPCLASVVTACHTSCFWSSCLPSWTAGLYTFDTAPPPHHHPLRFASPPSTPQICVSGRMPVPSSERWLPAAPSSMPELPFNSGFSIDDDRWPSRLDPPEP